MVNSLFLKLMIKQIKASIKLGVKASKILGPYHFESDRNHDKIIRKKGKLFSLPRLRSG